jgi:hypothetical protein
LTVTVCPEAADKVTVIEAGVVASLPLELATLNCTVGAGSSSVIVTVALDGLPNVAPPVGPDNVTVNYNNSFHQMVFNSKTH